MKFSEYMITECKDNYNKAIDNRFIDALTNGTLDPKVFSNYLVQDYAFIDSFLNLVSYTIAYSKNIEQKHKLAEFLAMITSSEDDYFIRSFKELGVREDEDTIKNVKRFPSIKKFDSIIKEAIDSRNYDECITVLAAAEIIYCKWANDNKAKQPEQVYFNEWLLLHNNDYFNDFVSWLREQLDKLEVLDEKKRKRIIELFDRMCILEAEFFEESFEVKI